MTLSGWTWTPRLQTVPSKHLHLGLKLCSQPVGLPCATAMGILGHAGASGACLGLAAQQLAPVHAASLQLGSPQPAALRRQKPPTQLWG